MKSLSLRNLFLVLVLTVAVAGIAWAGQPSAAPEAAPEAPVELEQDLDAQLDELLLDPEETGACCRAECFEQWQLCKDACPPFGDPNREACMNNCYNEHESCKSGC